MAQTAETLLTMKTRTLVITGVILTIVVVAMLTVLNKAWWMKRLRARHQLPWPASQDAEKSKAVSLLTIVQLVRTNVVGELAAGEAGPLPEGTTSAKDKMLKDAGFAW